MALDAIQHLRSPTDRLIVEALGIVMDEGLYCEVRMLAATSLSALLCKNARRFKSDGRAVWCEVVQKMNMLLDSPEPPVMHGMLRECLAAIDGESLASRPQDVLTG